MAKRKGRAYATEAPNLKRFREDVTDLVYEGALKGGNLGSTASATQSKQTSKGGLNRKERRKFMKKEKKQRVHNFQLKRQGKELPVVGKKGGGKKGKVAK